MSNPTADAKQGTPGQLYSVVIDLRLVEDEPYGIIPMSPLHMASDETFRSALERHLAFEPETRDLREEDMGLRLVEEDLMVEISDDDTPATVCVPSPLTFE